jgi:hypothetical protein
MNESIADNGSDGQLQSSGIARLMGKKSVRATFRLQPTAIALLNILAAQLGIKQKSLFDYLMEDEDALHTMAESRVPEAAAKEQRIQKTFVVSQRSLATLDAVTKRSAASRNDLIELSIQRLLPVLENERLRQNRRAAALKKITNHFDQGIALVDELRAMVGEEDTLCQSFVRVMTAFGKAVADMQNLVDKGKRVSEFPKDALKTDNGSVR